MLSSVSCNILALKKNVDYFQSLANVPILVAVKNNAYGLGLETVCRFMVEECDVSLFGICKNSEVHLCTKVFDGFGKSRNIRFVRLRPALAEEVRSAVVSDLCVEESISCIERWEQINKIGISCKRTIPVHIEIDVSVGRSGFRHETVVSQVKQYLKNNKEVLGTKVVGVSSHFAYRGSVTDTWRELLLFEDVVKELLQDEDFARIRNRDSELDIHIGGSCVALLFVDKLKYLRRLSFVRVGSYLYGEDVLSSYRHGHGHQHALVACPLPVLQWKTALVAIRMLPKGTPLGYEGIFSSDHDIVVGTLPVGFGDGLPLISRESSAKVLIRGVLCKIIGQVSANMTTVHLVGPAADAQLDEEVILIGTQGKSSININEFAKSFGANVSSTSIHVAVTRSLESPIEYIYV